MPLSRPLRFSAAALVFALGCAGSAPPSERPAPPLRSASPAPQPSASEALAPTAAPIAEHAPAPPAEPPSKLARCEAPPVGMACVPGGPAVIGADDQGYNEKPRHTVELGTFYIDRYEITNAQYDACHEAKACPRKANVDPRFEGPDLPAVPVTWLGAHAYCLWVGKRLPTEAEWEKASRNGEEGRLYPWGDAPASCERAQYGGCAPGTTKPVGSFPAGPYGVFDMAGNGYEWVSDWASNCYGGCPGACGKECEGPDPMGPCGGAPFCSGKKEHVLKGGSFRWKPTEMRGSWRRFEQPYTGAHRLSARCAASSPVLATWPPLSHTDPPAAPAEPAAPTEQELAMFRSVPADNAVLELFGCKKQSGLRVACHEPEHFVVSNEAKQRLWEPFIRNLGGGYAGVGSDQSYNLIATARSEWAWLFDYDPLIVRLHALLREVVLASDSPREFVDAFSPARFAETLKLVAPKLPDDEEREPTLRLFTERQQELYTHYKERLSEGSGQKTYDWLQNEDHYRYIRLLHRQGRIQSVPGNILTDVALPAIAASARKLGVPIRIFYSSNADDHWELTRRYRDNLLGLPVDEKSVFLRTVTPRRDRSKVWTYVVHSALDAQRKLAHDGWSWTLYFDDDGHPSAPDGLVAIGLPGRTEREKPQAPEP